MTDDHGDGVGMTDDRLQLVLERLGESLVFERADSFAGDVLAALDELPADVTTPHRRRWWPIVGAAAAVAIVLVAVPGPRRTIARWLGFDSVRIERTAVTAPPGEVTVPITDTTPTTVLDVDVALADLGPAVSADDARRRTGLEPPLAPSLGEPASIHVVAEQEVVVVDELDGTTILVAAIPARLEAGYFTKTLGPDSTLTEVDVGDAAGYWIAGHPHLVFLVDGDGAVIEQTLRLATNTLLFERDGVVRRIEGAISLDDALRLAAEL